jgi:FkbM family methyltransferase
MRRLTLGLSDDLMVGMKGEPMADLKPALSEIPILGKLARYCYWWAKLPSKVNRTRDDMQTMMEALAKVQQTLAGIDTKIEAEINDMQSMMYGLTQPKPDMMNELAKVQQTLAGIDTKIEAQRPGRLGDLISADALQRYDRSTLERVVRQRCEYCYMGRGVVLSRVLGKYKMFLDAEDITLTPHLLLDGFWEIWITAAVARFVRPGMVVVDVGANVGYYTLVLADLVGERGQVWACEPNPAIFQLLETNIAVNGFASRTHLVDKAIANTEGQGVTLHIPKLRKGDSTILAPPAAETAAITVQTATLDALLPKDSPVDFVKIDAEGAEELIWEGMLQTIQCSDKITIAMEFSAARYADAGRFLHAIVKEGFKLRHIDYDSQIRDISAEEVLRSQDWRMLFLQRH